MLLMNLAAAASVSSEAGFLTDWLHGLNVGGVILLLVGIALIVVEMVIPGFGIAGLSGGAAVIAGLIVSSKSFGAAMFSLARFCKLTKTDFHLFMSLIFDIFAPIFYFTLLVYRIFNRKTEW